jgi:dipeptidyl aminopeptidase/acylaminoacyl peptidase
VVKIASYGTWTSPISAAEVAELGGGPQWTALRAGRVWWAQSVASQGGRVTLYSRAPGEAAREVLPQPWNLRNRVHEYGGTPFTVFDAGDGERVVFTNWADQRLYLLDPHAETPEPTPISPEPATPQGLRHAEPVLAPGGAEIWCVREASTGELPTDIRRALVAVPLDGSAATDPDRVRELVASHHFLSGPVLSPDGRHAAWLGWNHPAMPWDGTELCVAEITDGQIGPHRVLAGGPAEAVCQIEWDGPDALLAMTDPEGWWNLHRIGLDGTATNLAPAEQENEFGGAMWQLGNKWFARLGPGRFAVLRGGRLALLEEAAGTVVDFAVQWPMWSATLAAEDGVLVAVAGGPTVKPAVVRLDVGSGELTEITEQPAGLPPVEYLPIPVERVFTDAEGRPIPAFVYPPTNPEFAGPNGEAPPYLVHVHGGPTGSSSPSLSLQFAYFTSRGFGVVAVNYGGSTGYGREFRERLREQWGLVDVQDCAAVAEALAVEGTADGDRLAIRGGSAGGWTSAASLTSVSTYRCGTVMFPILDLSGWTAEGGQTHDFESRYVEGLVGRLPEAADRYAERSPSRHADRLAGPVLMLQGLEDQICPPVQANEFMAALAGTGIPHAYLTFEGEQHGFRKAESIKAAIEAELSFYGQVFGFTPPGVPKLELSH